MRYAGFWIRFVASVADDLLVWIVSMVLTRLALGVVFVILRPAPTFGEAFSGSLIQIVGMGASIAVGFAYYTWMHYRYGQTLGKKMVGVIVRDEGTMGPLTLGQSIGRYFGHFLSVATLGIGYLMAAWSPRKKAMHDHLAGTVSVYVEKPEAILLPEGTSEKRD